MCFNRLYSITRVRKGKNVMIKYLSSTSILVYLVITVINCPLFAYEDQNADGIIVRLCPPQEE
jgi:hypothetical protein